MERRVKRVTVFLEGQGYDKGMVYENPETIELDIETHLLSIVLADRTNVFNMEKVGAYVIEWEKKTE